MVIARVDLPRGQEAPPLVCVEPAQLPNEGLLAARELSLVLQPADRSDEQQMTSHVTQGSADKQLSPWPCARHAG